MTGKDLLLQDNFSFVRIILPEYSSFHARQHSVGVHKGVSFWISTEQFDYSRAIGNTCLLLKNVFILLPIVAIPKSAIIATVQNCAMKVKTPVEQQWHKFLLQ